MSFDIETRHHRQQPPSDPVVVRPLPISVPLAHVALSRATDLLKKRQPVITVWPSMSIASEAEARWLPQSDTATRRGLFGHRSFSFDFLAEWMLRRSIAHATQHDERQLAPAATWLERRAALNHAIANTGDAALTRLARALGGEEVLATFFDALDAQGASPEAFVLFAKSRRGLRVATEPSPAADTNLTASSKVEDALAQTSFERARRIAPVYAAYRAELRASGRTVTGERVRIAANRVAHVHQHGATRGTHYIVVGFSSFSGAQIDLLAALAREAGQTVGSLTILLHYEPERRELFAAAARTIDRLGVAFAREDEINANGVGDISDFDVPRAPPLTCIEASLFGELDHGFREHPAPTTATDATVRDAVAIHGAASRTDEAAWVARRIARLIANDTPPGAIGIFTSDLATYGPLLHRALAAAHVPVDARTPLDAASSVVASFLAAFSQAIHARPTVAHVLPVLSHPLAGLSRAAAESIDHALRRNALNAPDASASPDPAQGLAQFASFLRGYTVETNDTAATALVDLLAHFWNLEAHDATTADYCAALLHLVAHIEATAYDLDDTASTLSASAAALTALRDIAHGLANDEKNATATTRAAPFFHLLRSALAAPVGSAHATYGNAVVVAALGDPRFGNFEIVFIVGLVEGELPAVEPSLRVLSRAALASLDAHTGHATAFSLEPATAEAQRYAFAASLALARRAVVLTWPQTAPGGAPNVRSSFVDAVVEALGDMATSIQETRAIAILPPTRDDATSTTEREEALVADLTQFRPDPAAAENAASLFTALEDAPSRTHATLAHALSSGEARLSHDRFAPLLTERHAQLSASALQAWVNCPFQFHVRRTLHIEPHGYSEHDVMFWGELSHALLERIYRAHGNDVSALLAATTPAALRVAIDDICNSSPTPSDTSDLATRVRALFDSPLKTTELDVRLAQISRAVEADAALLGTQETVEVFQRDGSRVSVTVTRSPHTFESSFGLSSPSADAPDAFAGADAHPALALDVDATPVALRGRIDRLDHVTVEWPTGATQKGLLGIDYKSGRPFNRARAAATARDAQYAVYTVAIERVLKRTPMGFVYLSLRDATFSGRTVEGVTPVLGSIPSRKPSDTSLSAQFFENPAVEVATQVEAISAWVRDLRAGRIDVAPDDLLVPCTHCEARPLCRVDEARFARELPPVALERPADEDTAAERRAAETQPRRAYAPDTFQQAIIDANERLVGVTASAGSGKTETLAQRIAEVLGNGDADIRSVVAFTFTERAAANLKKRLRKVLRDRARAAAEAHDPDRARRYRKLAASVHDASIGTVHAFCARLLRDYAIELGEPSSFEVIAQGRRRSFFRESLDALIRDVERDIKSNDAALAARAACERQLVSLFGTGVVDVVLPIVSRAVSEGREATDLRSRIEAIPGEPALLDKSEAHVRAQIESALTQVLEDAKAALDTLSRDVRAGRVQGLNDKQKAALATLPKDIPDAPSTLPQETVASVRAALSALTHGASKLMKSGNPEALALRDAKPWVHMAVTCDSEEARARHRTVRHGAIAFAARFLDRYEAFKRGELPRESGDGTSTLIEFDDMQTRVVRRLLSPPTSPHAQAIRARFTHIFVDESQDQSPVQNELVRLLSGPSTHVLTVGDAKQSIFGFRHAEVTEFTRRLSEARDAHDGVVRELATNYRSRPGVVRFVNHVVRGVARLLANATEIENALASCRGLPHGREAQLMHDILASGQQTPSREPGCFDDGTRVPNVEVTIQSGSRVPREVAAKRIARRVRALYDARAASNAPIAWRDIAILFRGRTALPEYEWALRSVGVPVAADHAAFAQRLEVVDLIQLLTALARPHDMFALTCVLRSPFFALSDDIITAWRLRQHDTLPTVEREALARARRLAERWSRRFHRLSARELLDEVYDTTGYPARVLAMPGGLQRYANVQLLRELAAEHGAGAGGAARLLVDLSAMADGESESRGDAPLFIDEEQTADAVTLTTIHHAKGLEWPVVLLVEAGPMLGQHNEPTLVLRDLGPVFRKLSVNPDDDASNALFDWARRATHATALAEELRLFYTAITRARELLIIDGTLSLSKREAFANAAEAARDGTFSYLNVLCGALDWGPALAADETPVTLQLGEGDESFTVSRHILAPPEADETSPDDDATITADADAPDSQHDALPATVRVQRLASTNQQSFDPSQVSVAHRAPDALIAKLRVASAADALAATPLEDPRDAVGVVPARAAVTPLVTFDRCPRRYFYANQARIRSAKHGVTHFAIAADERADDDRVDELTNEIAFDATPDDTTPGEPASVDPAAYGNLIHGVFELIDFADEPSHDAVHTLVTTVAAALGIVDATSCDRAVAATFALLRSPLRDEVLMASADSRRGDYRELPVTMLRDTSHAGRHGLTVVHGVIDLVIRRDDETLVIIDYKTTPKPRDPQKRHAWNLQLQAYALMLRDIESQDLNVETRVEAAVYAVETGELIAVDCDEASLASAAAWLDATLAKLPHARQNPAPSRDCAACPYNTDALCPEGRNFRRANSTRPQKA